MRTISKTFGGTVTIATVGIIEQGKPVFVEKRIEGRKSPRAVAARLKSELGTSNFLLKSTRHETTDKPITYNLDANVFFANSESCKPDKVYGHDTVCVGFKITIAHWYDANFEEHTFTLLGTTTQNKLRNAIIEEESREDVLIGDVRVITQKRWLWKDEFIALANADADESGESGEEE